jgi:hypothetical protein
MAMDKLAVDPDTLRAAAARYDGIADECAAARAENARAVEETATWGPLFHESRRAAVEAINAREAALNAEEAKNRAMAEQLRKSATEYEAMNAENAARLTISTE